MRLFFGILVALIPFALQYGYILNAFYHNGAVYFDAGLFANLIWRNDFLLPCSQYYGDFSYLGVHFSPLLVLMNQLSFFWPGGKVEFFATFMGLIYASLSVAMYYALLTCLNPRSLWKVAGLAALAVAFSFNGVVMQGIWMPHFEYAIPAGIFMFLLHHKLGNKGWALFFFILTLCLREDTGFHITALLGVLIYFDYRRLRSFKPLRPDLYFMLVAFGYSVFAWWMTFHMRAVQHVDGSVFQQIYTGWPPYAHLSFGMLVTRLGMMLGDRFHILLALLVTLIAARRTRNVYWLIGFIANIPWFLLNWASTNDNSGTLYAYYAFPFVLSFGWPFIGALWRYGAPLPGAARRQAFKIQLMLVIAGLICWNPYGGIDFGPVYWPGSVSYRPLEGPESHETARHFVDALGRSGDLGTLMADPGVMSLALGSAEQNDKRVILWHTESTPIDTLVYMQNSDGPPEEDFVQDQALANHLTSHYCVVDTTICFFTNRPHGSLGMFTSVAIEKPMALTPRAKPAPETMPTLSGYGEPGWAKRPVFVIAFCAIVFCMTAIAMFLFMMRSRIRRRGFK